MARVILMRHATSEWNALGRWTGLTDVSLSKKGREEAKESARYFEDASIDAVYTSTLSRSKETYEIVKKNAIGIWWHKKMRHLMSATMVFMWEKTNGRAGMR